jgi:hypothetical protein
VLAGAVCDGGGGGCMVDFVPSLSGPGPVMQWSM